MPRGILTATSALALVVLTGCTTSVTPHAPSTTTVPVVSSPTASTDTTAETPEEAFRAWLTASRKPDTAKACSYLSDALVERMLAEMKATGWPVTDCASMMTTTAELYAAVGDSPDVEVQTISETSDAAELHVTYLSGDCGRVAMERDIAQWIMTENSEEEC